MAMGRCNTERASTYPRSRWAQAETEEVGTGISRETSVPDREGISLRAQEESMIRAEAGENCGGGVGDDGGEEEEEEEEGDESRDAIDIVTDSIKLV